MTLCHNVGRCTCSLVKNGAGLVLNICQKSCWRSSQFDQFKETVRGTLRLELLDLGNEI